FDRESTVTSVNGDIKCPPAEFAFSGQGDSSAGTMLNRCLFFTQVCYLENAYCVRSDNRLLLLFPCPHGYGHLLCFVDVCCELVHCLSSLILSGDVESNPGPKTNKTSQANPGPNTRSRRNSTTEHSAATDGSGSDGDNADVGVQPTVANMFAQLLAGQRKLAQDIAEIKLFHLSVNSRFDALESRVAALESFPSASGDSGTPDANLLTEFKSLTDVVDRLVSRNDDLENRSRRNNLILHGLPEQVSESNELLMSNVSMFFSEKLAMDCPQIERCHRLGRIQDGRSRPVIMKLLDFRERLPVLKNCVMLKGSEFRVSEDFSPHVRSIRKKMWEASASFRNNGSSVRFRFDHVFIDNVRYNWDDATNALVKCTQRTPEATVSTSSTGPC
ncbi:unnamed protein product, partial [Ixodes pacificus]